MRPTVRRYRALRGIVRAVAVAAPGRRKAVTESLLRYLFGDVVEARGHLLEVDPADTFLGARLRRRGVWSAAETALYERFLRGGETVVDCGAHVGYFTLLFARLVGTQGRVVAFEPEPASARLLRANVARNGYENVQVFDSAVSRECGEASLSLATGNLGDHRLDRSLPGRREIRVATTTLDTHFGAGGRPPDLLKLDLQGGEPAAFDGARETVAAATRMGLLTEFWPSAIREAGDDPGRFLDEVAASGFSIAVLRESGSLLAVATEAERRRLADDSTDVNLFCRKGSSLPDG